MIDLESALAAFLRGGSVHALPPLRAISTSVDLLLATSVVDRLIERFPHALAAKARGLPVRVIRALVAMEPPTPVRIFVRTLALTGDSDDDLARAWSRTLEVFDLGRLSWDSTSHRDAAARLALDPEILHATQAAVASARSVTSVPRDMLAILAIDSSSASYDALVTHIADAIESLDDKLERISALRAYARTTLPMIELFDELDAAVRLRDDRSPARHLGLAMGLHALVWCEIAVRSRRQNSKRVPWIQGEIRIDGRRTPWFSVDVRTVDSRERSRATRFTDATCLDDELALGTCAPDALPRWLAAAATRLAIEWAPFGVTGNVAADDLDRVARWLASRPAPG